MKKSVGIEAGGNIEINSGTIEIDSLKEVFKAGKDISVQNVRQMELYSGSEKFPVQPFVSGGTLNISRSNIFIASYTCVKVLTNQQESLAYSGKISKDQSVSLWCDKGKIATRTIKREINYIYYTGEQTGLKFLIDKNEVEKIDPKSCQAGEENNKIENSEDNQQNESPQGGNQNGGSQNGSSESGNQNGNSGINKMSNILIFISLILLN